MRQNCLWFVEVEGPQGHECLHDVVFKSCQITLRPEIRIHVKQSVDGGCLCAALVQVHVNGAWWEEEPLFNRGS